EPSGCSTCALTDGLVNPFRLSREIRIKGASNDARVLIALAVEANEVPSIQGEHGAIFSAGKLQHFIVGHGLLGFDGLVRGQHVVAKPTQTLDDGQREVFVGIEPRHQSASFSSIKRLISSRWERT